MMFYHVSLGLRVFKLSLIDRHHSGPTDMEWVAITLAGTVPSLDDMYFPGSILLHHRSSFDVDYVGMGQCRTMGKCL